MKRLLLFIVLVVSIPFLVINFFYSYKITTKLSGFNSNRVEHKKINIRILRKNNTVENLDLEDYLVGVVSSEVPIYFEEEALKAQVVAARTYALKQIENNTNKEYDVTDDTSSQVYSTIDELKERWGNKYEENYNKIKNIVNSTKGEYISYNDDYIYAFFFSTSNGRTEDNKNVFGEDLPYLKSVDSSFDEEETDSFETTKEFLKEDFYNKLEIPYKESLVVDNIKRSESNRVLSININGISFKGREFQKKLGLRSNDFTIEESNNILITTKGFGHGVGMSQYGANALAKRNKKYQEIIKYYYQGTEIKKL